MSEPEHIELNDRATWRRWLERNHPRQTGVWLVTYKKSAGKPRIDYEAAVEEAICFGWIDSKSKAVDDERTSLYFAPRRPKSNWTDGNIARFERLEAAGLMTDAGREAFSRGSRRGPRREQGNAAVEIVASLGGTDGRVPSREMQLLVPPSVVSSRVISNPARHHR